MSEESETKPSDDPVDPAADESAAAAKEAAKDFANNAGAAFQGLNQRSQIYLVALAITLVCSFLFGAFKTKVEMGKEFKEIAEFTKQFTGHNMKSKQTSPSLVGLKSNSGATGGKLAFLGAAAGIGILLWSTASKRKDPWIPLGLAAAAGIAVLGILMTRSGISSGSSFGGTSFKTSGTLLGWWLPLAAAVVATVVSVQRITKA
ncbi:MAG: hypothetical protein ACR2RV_08035 [Verrucomicrobiales bacterium]